MTVSWCRLRFWFKNRKFKKEHPGQICFISRELVEDEGPMWPEGWVSLGYTEDTEFPH